MSGGFKWLEIPGGMYQTIADDAGKILAHVFHPPKGPAQAYIGQRRIGDYISTETARNAIEDAWADRDRESGAHSGRIDERSSRQ